MVGSEIINSSASSSSPEMSLPESQRPDGPSESRLPLGTSSQHLSWSSSDRYPPLRPVNSEERVRRQSVTERINTLANVGGVNSFTNFARSWQRAADFRLLSAFEPIQPLDNPTAEDEGDFERSNIATSQQSGSSLLRAAFQQGRRISEQAVQDGPDTQPVNESPFIPIEEDTIEQRIRRKRSMRRESMSQFQSPRFLSPNNGTFGSSYGSVPSQAAPSSMQQADRLYHEQQASRSAGSNKETDPLLGQQAILSDEEERFVITGQSTVPQTIFNSVNVLVGVGLLSLPLALEYSGWIIGLAFFSISALTTSYTAKLLAKCLNVDDALISFADIAYVSFGSRAKLVTSIIFLLELLGACVALVVLFADSVDALFPGWGITNWKIICGIILIPLGFVPLKFLSFTSVLGIISCLGIIVAIFADGIIKPHAPGSLREPATTYLLPADWRTLPLSFGLLMAPWGGHGVFPNLYRDMRHPSKYSSAVNTTYVFTYSVETAIAIVGYLMFGSSVRDEITSNIFKTEGYPEWISVCIVAAIAIIPLTKIPLNARPIFSTLEVMCGLDPRDHGRAINRTATLKWKRRLIIMTVRITAIAMFVIVAIAVPSFDRIMSLLGSFACFNICIVFPAAFHLKIFGKEISRRQKVLDWTLIVVCTILAVLGTVSVFLPAEMLGVRK